jgi:glyoxylase-like metal-dependent hydrolase (beta-lactamase superfamily II)
LAGEALLTGDTLFVDAVGRPDLERGDAGAENGARLLHRCLHERILTRADGLAIHPAHHAAPVGFDGAPIGATLGEIRRRTQALALDEEAFVRKVVDSLRQKPGNFESIIAINEGKAELGGEDPLDLEAGPNSCAAG